MSLDQRISEEAHTEPPVPRKDLTWRMDQARLQEHLGLDLGLDGLATEGLEVRCSFRPPSHAEPTKEPAAPKDTSQAPGTKHNLEL